MHALYFVMAIMGCGDGNVDCTEARIVPARYETMAQCREALPDELARNTDVPFPSIGANCRSVGAQMAKADERSPRG